MCLLALFYRVVEDAPLVVGANREELYARGGEAPQRTTATGPSRSCHALAGIDPVAGGTWLGVNEHGVLIAVTNRRKTRPPERPRSRGLLARELLAFASAGGATERAARELARNAYDGCNILCADGRGATVLQAGDWLRVRPLPPGLHVLTNGDVNDPLDRRLGYVMGRLGKGHYQAAAECLSALREVCGDPGSEGPPVCLRAADRGTVSSTLLALRPPPACSTLLHAQGPPDVTPYVDLSGALNEVLASPPANA